MADDAPAGAGALPDADAGKVPLTLHIGFFAMMIGMFMSILDVQIVASSIHEIQAGVSASGDEIAWVQTAYLIAEVVGIPLSGFLNRVFGMRRLFLMSAAGFTGASLLCALSWDLQSLIVFRCIQGFVGAAMVPTTMAAAFTLFPGGRSMTQQVMVGMVATLAPSIGPTLGGWVTEHSSWHWLFLLNVLPGIAAIVLVYMFVPRQKGDMSLLRRMDLIGLAGMALMLGSLEWVVEEGPKQFWFESREIIAGSLVCVLAGVVFFYRSLTTDTPVVDLKVFRDRNFASGALVGAVMGLGLYGSTYILPLFLGQARGLSSLQIGQIMSVSGVAMFFGGPLAGALTRKFDPRLVLTAGLLLIGLGTLGNAHMTSETGFEQLFWPQVMRGVGLIMTMVPTTTLAIGFLKPELVANASGIFTSVRNLGGAIGIALLNTMMLHFRSLHEQELAAGMDPSRPEVQDFISRSTAALQASGAADPHGAAVAQLIMRMQQEALIMTFNNLFFWMAMSFVAVLSVVLVLKKPAAMTAAPQGH
jgi:DHA2 family multidrug resistance protein